MKTVMKYFLLLTVFFLVACSQQTGSQAQSGAQRTLQPLVFKKGTYRQDGTCIKLVQDNVDMTAICNSFIGIIATEDDRPRFTFSQHNGDFWAFTASGPATYANDNRIAVYPVSHIYQMSSKLDILYEGECRISIDGRYDDVDCTTWKDKNRSQEAWKASFVGSGAWRYKPN